MKGRPKKHSAGRQGRRRESCYLVPLPLWPQSASPTGAKEAEEHEQKWRFTQGGAPPSASLALGWYVSRFQRFGRTTAGRRAREWTLAGLRLNYQSLTDYPVWPNADVVVWRVAFAKLCLCAFRANSRCCAVPCPSAGGCEWALGNARRDANEHWAVLVGGVKQ